MKFQDLFTFQCENLFLIDSKENTIAHYFSELLFLDINFCIAQGVELSFTLKKEEGFLIEDSFDYGVAILFKDYKSFITCFEIKEVVQDEPLFKLFKMPPFNDLDISKIDDFNNLYLGK
jgi:hypothetical protein